MRIYAAACVCDVLRIFAPEAPYSVQELQAIFQRIAALLEELPSMPDKEAPEYRVLLYVVESLAVIKSCVLLVDLATSPELDAGESTLVDFLAAAVRSVTYVQVGLCAALGGAGVVACKHVAHALLRVPAGVTLRLA